MKKKEKVEDVEIIAPKNASNPEFCSNLYYT